MRDIQWAWSPNRLNLKLAYFQNGRKIFILSSPYSQLKNVIANIELRRRTDNKHITNLGLFQNNLKATSWISHEVIGKKPSPSCIKLEQKLITDYLEIADVFYNYFSNKARRLNLQNTLLSPLPNSPSFCFYSITVFKIKKINHCSTNQKQLVAFMALLPNHLIFSWILTQSWMF